MIELRSDTFTKPDPAMLAFMMAAEVGDNVHQEDPSVNELERFCADLFEKESAVFCPSGTMSNQIAIQTHCAKGDEVICHSSAHVYQFEAGGIAANAQCSTKTLDGAYGKFSPSTLLEAIRPKDIHYANSKLICIENTSNLGGGHYWELEELDAIGKIATQNNLNTHMDGARLFNAMIATGTEAKMYSPYFDSISICLSKGLGAPIGSVLIGNKEFIQKSRRHLKRMGGFMRQAGYMAAGGIYALKNNRSKIENDHKTAKKIEGILNLLPYIDSVNPVQTNIIVFHINKNQIHFMDYLKKHHILCFALGKGLIRMVTSMNFNENQLNKLQEVLQAYHPKKVY